MAINEVKLKNSFKKVKEDIISLSKELKEAKNLIIKQNKLIIDIKSQISTLNRQEIENKDNFNAFLPGSTGNKGVKQASNQASNQAQSKQATNQPFKQDMLNFKKDLDFAFTSLPKQQFLTFLTLYQLEDDLNRPVNYEELSEKLNLSEGCIRAYISFLLKKGIPIAKIRVNNKTTVLSINQKFRELNLKSHLFSVYMKDHQAQTAIIDY
ncbi:hypothetical protein J4405_01670 [Candidatus Woesearchaeota archaeon]|nr:hypothetical protein [Candidatus Woesearchaeota archaeon]